jgi:DNA-binding NarL/FixJ family response regulator
VRALEAGARGILLETASAEDLIKAIRVVHEGQIWASKTVMARIVEAFASRAGAIHTTERLLAQRLLPWPLVVNLRLGLDDRCLPG